MTIVGMTFLIMALIGYVSSALESPPEIEPTRDTPAPSGPGIFDALIFLLCLAGILAAKHRRESEED